MVGWWSGGVVGAMGGGGSGLGALTMVLGTHCKSELGRFGCKAGLGKIKERLSMARKTLRNGAVRGDCTMGDVFVSLCTPREASWIIFNWGFDYCYK